MAMKKQSGLTLIEMMITVGIIGILAAVTWPLYNAQSRQKSRADAVIAITKIAHALEKHRSDAGDYGSIAAADFGNYMPSVNQANPQECIRRGFQGNGPAAFTSCNNHYTLAVVAAGATYTITANPASTALAAETECTSLSLDHLGVKGAGGSSTLATGVSRVKRCWGSD